MKVSLPTPLGPLMTMIRGLGFGERGSELKGEPMEASRARRRSERSAFSKVGIGTNKGLRASPILEEEKDLMVWGDKGFCFCFWVSEELRMVKELEDWGFERRGREVQRSLRNMEHSLVHMR